MGEYLGDKPSSRVLRPPGGQSSNIFGGPDTSPARKTNTKPTYQSSVFSSEPEPPRPQSGNRRGNMSSNIFGSEPVNNSNNVKTVPQKISKTHQSSVFQDPLPLSEEKRTAMADHRISNIPMFSAGTEEYSKPLRRPITAPTQMPSSLNLSSDTNYATDTKPGPGVRKTARTAAAPRHDPITGKAQNTASPKTPPPVAETPPPVAKVETKENVQSKPAKPVTPEVRKDNNPHLGAVKNTSGVRSIQPPGGKSSISFF